MARDPYNFLRGWVKIPTNLLEQEDFCTLTFEERGVFLTAALYTTKNGEAPGYFVDRDNHQPMSAAHIVRRLTPDVPAMQAVSQERAVFASFDVFVQRSLFTHSEDAGYAFHPDVFAQFLNENNLASKHKYDAGRQARSRAARKAREAAAAAAKQPIQLRRVEDA